MIYNIMCYRWLSVVSTPRKCIVQYKPQSGYTIGSYVNFGGRLPEAKKLVGKN